MPGGWSSRAIVVVGCLGVLRSGQQPPVTAPVFKSATRAVEIHVAVRDARGNPVRGLTRADFRITDNGKPREIQLFSADDTGSNPTAAPALPPGVFSNRFGPRQGQERITALVIDTLLTTMPMQSEAREHAIRAVERMQPGETMAIYSIEGTLRILQDYTSDRKKLLDSLEDFSPPPKAFVAQLVRTELLALQLVAEQMAGASGRKSIVWISRGFPQRLYVRNGAFIDNALRAFNDADVALYAVDPVGVNPQTPLGPGLPGGGGLDTNMIALREFAEGTGGRGYVFRNDMDKAITEALDDSQYVYELGFYLSSADFDGKFHRLTVKVPARLDLRVTFRKGYTAALSPQPADREAKADAALLSPIDSADVGIDATVKITAGATGQEAQVSLGLDPASLGRDKNNTVALDEVLLEADEHGRQVARISETLHMNQPAGPAIRYSRKITLVDGAVTLRVLIKDRTSARTGSLTIPLTTK